jgi:hypothetical protein
LFKKEHNDKKKKNACEEVGLVLPVEKTFDLRGSAPLA